MAASLPTTAVGCLQPGVATTKRQGRRPRSVRSKTQNRRGPGGRGQSRGAGPGGARPIGRGGAGRRRPRARGPGRSLTPWPQGWVSFLSLRQDVRVGLPRTTGPLASGGRAARHVEADLEEALTCYSHPFLAAVL